MQCHSKLVQWRCCDCSQQFDNHHSLYRHISAHHIKGIFACAYRDCTFTGETRKKVYMHFVAHNAAANSNLFCPAVAINAVNKSWCAEREFSSGVAIESHISQMHNYAGKWKCVVCSQEFKYCLELKQHIEQQHDETKFISVAKMEDEKILALHQQGIHLCQSTNEWTESMRKW